MYDSDEHKMLNNQPKTDTTQQDFIEELKTTALFINGSHNKLSEESTRLRHVNDQILQSTELLAKMVKQSEAIVQQVRHGIQQTTEQAARPIEALKIATHQATEYITAHQKTLIASLYWRWGSLMLTALFGGLLSGLIIQPYLLTQTFTETQWKQLEAGKALLNAWDKLNHTEQQKILAFDVDQKIFQPKAPQKPKQVHKKTVSQPMHAESP